MTTRWLVSAALAVAACRAPADPIDVDATPSSDAAVDARVIVPSIDAARPSPVRSVLPEDGAIEIERQGTIEAHVAPNPYAWSLCTFTVTRDGEAVPGAVEYYGFEGMPYGFRFKPAHPMEPDATYRATLRLAIIDSQGFVPQLEDPYSWSFTTTSRMWDEPIELEPAIGALRAAATDPSGVIYLLWNGPAATPGLYARRFVPSTGWEPAALVDPDVRGDADLTLHIGRGGHAVALWHYESETNQAPARMSRFVPGSGWSASTRVDPDGAIPSRLATAAVTDDGTALVMYRHFDVAARRMIIWIRAQRADGTWEEPVALRDVTSSTHVLEYQPMPYAVVVDRAGNVAAIGVEHRFINGQSTVIWARHYVPGTGWGEWREIDQGAGGSAPQAVVDDAGVITVVWAGEFNIHGLDVVWATRFEHGVWTDRKAIAAGWRLNPNLVAEPSGAVTAAWMDEDVGGIRATRFEPGLGWQPAMQVDDGGHMGWITPSTVVSPSSTAVVTWSEIRNHRKSVLARRYTATGGWNLAAPVEPTDVLDTRYPQVVMTPSGEAIVFFHMQTASGTDALWMSHYR